MPYMEIPAWVAPLLEQTWSFVAVALAVNALGTVSKRIADKMGWRRYRRSQVAALITTVRESRLPGSSGDAVLPSDASWYDITLRLHPIVGGAIFGLVPLPTLHVIDALAKDPDAGPNALIAARCAWFMLAGALSGQVYEAIKFAFTEGRARLLSLIGRKVASAPSNPPPPLDPSNEDR